MHTHLASQFSVGSLKHCCKHPQGTSSLHCHKPNTFWPSLQVCRHPSCVCTMQVPYGTSFHQNVQWACRYEGRGKCRLRVTGEVEFTKSPFVKGMIQKASEEVCWACQASAVHNVQYNGICAVSPVMGCSTSQDVYSFWHILCNLQHLYNLVYWLKM